MNKIEKRIALTEEAVGAEYANTLRGPRTRGSTTVRSLTDYGEVDFKRAIDQSLAGPGTVILEGECPGIGGVQKVLTLQEAMDRGLNVRIQKGAHGPELVADGEGIGGVLTDHVTLIVAGENNPDKIAVGGLITWYPGKPTAYLDTYAGVKIQ